VLHLLLGDGLAWALGIIALIDLRQDGLGGHGGHVSWLCSSWLAYAPLSSQGTMVPALPALSTCTSSMRGL